MVWNSRILEARQNLQYFLLNGQTWGVYKKIQKLLWPRFDSGADPASKLSGGDFSNIW